MSTDFLSQDDIDALLGAAINTGGGSSASSMDTGEVVTNIINCYNQHIISVWTTNLGREVAIEIEYVDSVTAASISEKTGGKYIITEVPFSGGCDGSMRALASKDGFAAAINLMLGGSGWTDDYKDAVAELFNQVSGAFSTELGGKIGTPVSAGAAAILDEAGSEAFEGDYTAFCKITIDGIEPILILISPDETLLGSLSDYFGGKKEEPATAAMEFIAPSAETGNAYGKVVVDNSFSAKAPKINVDMLLDIELEVAIELGKANVAIKKVLDFAPGALIELDRFAGEPVDLLVNNKIVAKGEVVVIDENFGVRIISLVSPEERIKSLR